MMNMRSNRTLAEDGMDYSEEDGEFSYRDDQHVPAELISRPGQLEITFILMHMH